MECLFFAEHFSGILPQRTTGKGIWKKVGVEASQRDSRERRMDLATKAAKGVLVLRTNDTNIAHHFGYETSMSI